MRRVAALDSNTGHPIAGAELAAGGSSWLSISDRKRKEKLASVDGQAILGKLSVLPICEFTSRARSRPSAISDR